MAQKQTTKKGTAPATILKISPTLFIGVGGTGRQVLSEIKRLFYQHPYFKGLPPMVSFLCIDTDDGQGTWKDEARQQFDLDDSEFHFVSADLNDIRNNLQSREFLRDWVPADHLMGVDLSGKGAKQIRYLGRLCFFENAADIGNAIAKKLDSITHVSNKLATTTIQTQLRPPVIFVVNSTCGGTGSGMLIDLAYLTREISYKYRYQGKKPYITGYLLTSDAFDIPDAMDNLHANNAATLLELDYFMTTNHKRYQPRFTKSIAVRTAGNEKAFDICYLVSGKGIKDSGKTSLILGHGIFNQVITDIGGFLESRRDNPEYTLIDPEEQKSSAFSTYGFASIFWPGEKIRKLFSQRLSRDLVGEVEGARLGQVTTRVAQFLTRFRIWRDEPKQSTEGIVASGADAIVPFTVDQVFSAKEFYARRSVGPVLDLAAAARGELLQSVDRLKSQWALKDEDVLRHESLYKGRLHNMRESFVKEYNRQIGEILSDPEFGVEAGVQFTLKVIAMLNDYSLAWKDCAEIRAKAIDAAEKSFRRTRNELIELLDGSWIGGFLGRTAKIAEKIGFLSPAPQNIAANFLTRHRVSLLADLLVEIGEQLQAILNQHLYALQGNLKKLADVDLPLYLTKAETDLANDIRDGLIVDRPVISMTDDLAEGGWLYSKILFGNCTVDEATERSKMALLKVNLLNELDLRNRWREYCTSFGAFKDRLEEYSKARFEAILEMGIDDYITEKLEALHGKGDCEPKRKDLAQLARNLYVASNPLTVHDPRKVVKPHRMLVLGVPKVGSTVFSDAILANKQVSDLKISKEGIGYPQRVVMLRTVEAVPVSSLESCADWMEKYRSQAGSRPLHSILNEPGLDWSSHTLLRDDFDKHVREAAFYYYVGLELKVIEKRKATLAEQKKYFLPGARAGATRSEMPLGDSNLGSIRELCGDTAKLTELKQRIKRSPRLATLSGDAIVGLMRSKIAKLDGVLENEGLEPDERRSYAIIRQSLADKKVEWSGNVDRAKRTSMIDRVLTDDDDEDETADILAPSSATATGKASAKRGKTSGAGEDDDR